MREKQITLTVPTLTVREGRMKIGDSDAAVDTARAFLLSQGAPMDREVFGSLHLNTRGRLTHAEIVGIGTATACLVHPREVFRSAVREGAVSIICFHSHPSGEVDPSDDDLEVNERLIQAGEILGIHVLDNLIITLNPGGGRLHWSSRGEEERKKANEQ